MLGSVRRRSLASSSCPSALSYGDCVSEETSFQIAVAWLHKWSKSNGEVLQWTAHKMTSHNCIYLRQRQNQAIMAVDCSFQIHRGNRIKQRREESPQHSVIQSCERFLLQIICLTNVRMYTHTHTHRCCLPYLSASLVLTEARLRSCLSKCEDYLKVHLVAASSPAEPKGQLPEQGQPLKRAAL